VLLLSSDSGEIMISTLSEVSSAVVPKSGSDGGSSSFGRSEGCVSQGAICVESADRMDLSDHSFTGCVQKSWVTLECKL
jgi:hypothetical protein